MCASIPTVRLFLKAVAPGLMSSGNDGLRKPTSGGLSYTSTSTSRRSRLALYTIGSAPSPGLKSPRQDYDRFDEESGRGMETMVTEGSSNKDFDKAKPIEQLSDEGDSNNRSREWNGDGNSNQGIVITTTEVSFSK